MKLKITKILETKQPFQPQGKSYKIYQWVVSGELEGVHKDYLLIKSFQQLQLVEGQELNVQEQNYQGNVSYLIEKPGGNKGFTKYSKPSYNINEYDDLFVHAVNLAEKKIEKMNIQDNYNKMDLVVRLASTYIISAVNVGVKVPDKKDDIIQNNINKLDEVFNNQSLQDDKEYPEDEKIPF